MTTTKSKVVYNPVFTDGAEFRIPTFKLLKQDGSLYKGAKAPELDKDKALRIYRAMVTTRILDERMLAARERIAQYPDPKGLRGLEAVYILAVQRRQVRSVPFFEGVDNRQGRGRRFMRL